MKQIEIIFFPCLEATCPPHIGWLCRRGVHDVLEDRVQEIGVYFYTKCIHKKFS